MSRLWNGWGVRFICELEHIYVKYTAHALHAHAHTCLDIVSMQSRENVSLDPNSMLTPFYNAMHCKVLVKLLWWRIMLFHFQHVDPKNCFNHFHMHVLYIIIIIIFVSHYLYQAETHQSTKGKINGPGHQGFSRRRNVSLRCQTYQIPTSTQRKNKKLQRPVCKCHPKRNVWAMEYSFFWVSPA